MKQNHHDVMPDTPAPSSEEVKEELSTPVDPEFSEKGMDNSEKVEETVDEMSQLKATVAELNEKMINYEKSVEESREKMLRSYAELENYRKRKDQEIETYRKHAIEKLVLELLPIMDGFERASSFSKKEEAGLKEIIEGYSLLQKQLEAVFHKFHVSRIEALNKTFDPHQHQAVLQTEKTGVRADTIIEEMQAGYTLYDRVIRPSLVAISK